jgi:hypothetical protein
MSSRRPTPNPQAPNRSREPRCPRTSPAAKNRTASARRASPPPTSRAESRALTAQSAFDHRVIRDNPNVNPWLLLSHHPFSRSQLFLHQLLRRAPQHCATLMPSFSIAIGPGADAPNRSIPITAPLCPTYFHQPIVAPASSDTFGVALGKQLSLVRICLLVVDPEARHRHHARRDPRRLSAP